MCKIVAEFFARALAAKRKLLARNNKNDPHAPGPFLHGRLDAGRRNIPGLILTAWEANPDGIAVAQVADEVVGVGDPAQMALSPIFNRFRSSCTSFEIPSRCSSISSLPIPNRDKVSNVFNHKRNVASAAKPTGRISGHRS
jgi:hypothetical protein